MFSTLASPTQVTVLGSWAMTAPLMGEGGCQWKCTGSSILPNQGWDPASLVCRRMELRLTLASCLDHLQLVLFQWLGAECDRREHNKAQCHADPGAQKPAAGRSGAFHSNLKAKPTEEGPPPRQPAGPWTFSLSHLF